MSKTQYIGSASSAESDRECTEPDTPDSHSNSSEVEETLKALRENYRKKLPQKLWLIKDLWQKLLHLNWDKQAFYSLHRLIHSLAGSGKTFGFDALSDHAKTLDSYLTTLDVGNSVPAERDRLHITSLLDELEQVQESGAGKDFPGEATFNLPGSRLSAKDKVVYIVDDDEDLAQYLSTLLSAAGFSVLAFPNPQLACDSIGEKIPDIIVMDIMFPDAGVQGFDFIEEIRAAAGTRVPVVFLSGRTDLSARLHAIRAGGDAYFTKPIEFDSLFAKIGDLISDAQEDAYRVLIVDDDKDLSEYYALTLNGSGMIAETLNNPINIMRSIERFKPNAIIMDLYMPKYNGLELTSVLRQNEDLFGLPVIFVTSEDRKDYKSQALGLGANDYLTKPVSEDDLIEAVYKQVRCSKQLRNKLNTLTKNNLSTGLVNRNYFLSRLENAIAFSHGKDGPRFSLLDIMIDNYDVVRGKTGLEWADDFNKQIALAISAQLSGTDIATISSDGVFMVLSENCSSTGLLELGNTISNTIADRKMRLGNQHLSVTCSIGAVEMDGSINSVHDLLLRAEAASLNASKSGGKQVAMQQKRAETRTQGSENLQTEIVEHIERRSFKLVYQPIISLENSSAEMYETLLRMVSKDDQILLPSQFMPIVEQEKRAIDVDRWVIENAIKSLSDDSHARVNSDLFVKICAGTLQSKMLMPLISNTLSDGRIVGDGRIIFSIGEKDVITHSKDVLAFAKDVKSLHCGFSIDHFGTTDSSIRLLDEIPVDYIKLRSTVLDNFMVNKEKQNFVSHLIDQAKSRKVEVIACSIEDPATISALWNMGARFFQGYFIKEPDNGLKYNFQDAVLQ